MVSITTKEHQNFSCRNFSLRKSLSFQINSDYLIFSKSCVCPLGFLEDFDSGSIQNCLNSLDQLRHSSFSRNRTSHKKGKKGPEATTVKAKFYHLPDASRVPKFMKRAGANVDPLLLSYMRSGYGKCFSRHGKVLFKEKL